MKIIGHHEIAALGISPRDAYQWVVEALTHKDAAVLPTKISMRQEDHIFTNIMPCILPAEDRMGVKIISRHPEKSQAPTMTSQILLYERSSGELLAIMDGSYITAMRTGAVAAHSALLLANESARNIGFLGSGVTAAATLDVLAAITPEREWNINLLRYKRQAERFAQRHQNDRRLRFEIQETPVSVIRESEIVFSCVTYCDGNFAHTDDFRPGCVVIPVHTRGFQNCDTEFDKVFADDIGHIKDFRYFNRFKSIAEIGDVLCGRASGRDNSAQRILVYNIGLALHDVHFANKILDRLSGLPDYNLAGPEEKMWL